ncbi:hypothetical protein B0H19DRAFT_1245679 [Mycena capillaripes]|nr:hypothetical protein B0H19DRAFT_1245679 [Mycena capillaripes]
MSCNVVGSFQESHLLPNSTQINQLRDILRSGTLPEYLPSEIATSVRSVIDEAPRELARYDDAIHGLEETLARLRSDRASLASYSDGCRSVFSPARRLATELLAEIFDLLYADSISDTVTQTMETNRIAKKYLLQLSQVCSRWYAVAMRTPGLWSTMVVDTNGWPESASASGTLLELLASSLERGGEHPLNLQIAVDGGHPMEQPILELVSQHSRRWKTVYLWLHPPSFRFLISAKGNLPVLESLTLVGGTQSEDPYVDDVFEVAPRLRTVSMYGWFTMHPILPWEQLLAFVYWNANSHRLSFDMIPLLSRARCELIVNGPAIISTTLHLGSVISNVSTLMIRFSTDPDPLHTQEIMGAILGCLTLPSLTQLRFIRPDAPAPLWNQTRFLEFASRSSLCNTLTSFEVCAIIEEQELLDCLSVLPMVQELYLWDSADQPGEHPHHTVITDSLLHQLSWRPNHTNFLPRLNFLCLTSLLRFRDDSLLDCITSRINPCRSNGRFFRTDIFWMSACDRRLSSEFVAQVSELDGLTFSVDPDVDFWTV